MYVYFKCMFALFTLFADLMDVKINFPRANKNERRLFMSTDLEQKK